MQGEVVFKDFKSNMLLFPYIQQAINLPSDFQLTQNTTFLDAVYYNNLFCVAVQDTTTGLYNLLIYNTQDQTYAYYKALVAYGGMVITGDKIVAFVNNTTMIDLTTFTEYNFSINNQQGQVLRVASFNPETFLIYMETGTNQYTLYVISMLNIGSIIAGTTTDFVSLNYTTLTVPYTNVNIYVQGNTIYVVGKEGTAVLELVVKDLVYLQTKRLYPYQISPLEGVTNIDLDGRMGKTVKLVTSHNFLVVYDNLEDQWLFIDPSNPSFVYLGNKYWFVNPSWLYDRYNGVLLNISLTPIGNIAQFNVAYRYTQRITQKGLFKKFFYKVRQEYDAKPFFVNIHYQFGHLYNTLEYVCADVEYECYVNVVAHEFLIDVLPIQPCIFDDFKLDFLPIKD